jgi:mycoredoxin
VPQIKVYSKTACGDCRLAKGVLDMLAVDYKEVDVEHSAAALEEMLSVNGGIRKVPTVLFEDGAALVEPGATELRAAVRARMVKAEQG